MSQDLNACTTIGRDQADILRGSTRIARREDRTPASEESTIIQAARVPAAGVAALATTVQMRRSRGARAVAWLKAWAWIFAGAAAFAFLGYLSAAC